MPHRTCCKCLAPFLTDGRANVCETCRVPLRRRDVSKEAIKRRPITNRERSVIACVVRELPDKLIADELKLSEGTVGMYLCHIYQKLNVSGRMGLVKWGMRNGFDDQPPTT